MCVAKLNALVGWCSARVIDGFYRVPEFFRAGRAVVQNLEPFLLPVILDDGVDVFGQVRDSGVAWFGSPQFVPLFHQLSCFCWYIVNDFLYSSLWYKLF